MEEQGKSGSIANDQAMFPDASNLQHHRIHEELFNSINPDRDGRPFHRVSLGEMIFPSLCLI